MAYGQYTEDKPKDCRYRGTCKPCAFIKDEFQTNGMEPNRSGEDGAIESVLL